MPSAPELLQVARHLAAGVSEAGPPDAELRRAVSTAYYALFDQVVDAGADRFSHGVRNPPAHSMVYRAFQHRAMRSVCEALREPRLSPKYQRLLARTSMTQEIRDFAGAFSHLQELRHLADYDPGVHFYPGDVSALIDAAQVAIDAFDRSAAQERADVLALLLVNARG